MKKYDAVIFDFDGTIADTGEGIIKSVEYALTKYGYEIENPKKLHYFIGPSLFKGFKDMYGADDEMCQKLTDAYRERYSEKGILECQLYEGIMNVVSELKNNCIKVGIASAKPTFYLFKIISNFGLTDLFDTVVGTELEIRNADKGALINTALGNLGIEDTSYAIMVGDRNYDINGAKAAEIDSIGVLYGYGTKEELLEANATYIVSDVNELKGILLR